MSYYFYYYYLPSTALPLLLSFSSLSIQKYKVTHRIGNKKGFAQKKYGDKKYWK